MDLGSLIRGNTATGESLPVSREGGCIEVQLPDFSGLESGEVVKLILQADSARRQLDGYLTVLLGRFGDLEGQGAVEEL